MQRVWYRIIYGVKAVFTVYNHRKSGLVTILKINLPSLILMRQTASRSLSQTVGSNHHGNPSVCHKCSTHVEFLRCLGKMESLSGIYFIGNGVFPSIVFPKFQGSLMETIQIGIGNHRVIL